MRPRKSCRPFSWNAIERGLETSRTSRSSTGSHSRARHVARAVGDARVGELAAPRSRSASAGPGERLLQRAAEELQALDAPADGQEAPAVVARHAVEREAGERHEGGDVAVEFGQRLRERDLAAAAARQAARHVVERAPVVERQALAQLRGDAQQLLQAAGEARAARRRRPRRAARARSRLRRRPLRPRRRCRCARSSPTMPAQARARSAGRFLDHAHQRHAQQARRCRRSARCCGRTSTGSPPRGWTG